MWLVVMILGRLDFSLCEKKLNQVFQLIQWFGPEQTNNRFKNTLRWSCPFKDTQQLNQTQTEPNEPEARKSSSHSVFTEVLATMCFKPFLRAYTTLSLLGKSLNMKLADNLSKFKILAASRQTFNGLNVTGTICALMKKYWVICCVSAIFAPVRQSLYPLRFYPLRLLHRAINWVELESVEPRPTSVRSKPDMSLFLEGWVYLKTCITHQSFFGAVSSIFYLSNLKTQNPETAGSVHKFPLHYKCIS